MKLLMLKGLPASGKSTYAKELLKEGNWVRTNKDDLRQLLHGGKWSKSNEKQVCAVRDDIVTMALAEGKNVVVDDTNYHPSHESVLRQIAAEMNAQFEIKEFDTDVEECIARDLHRGEKAVGEQVIRRMWRDNVSPVQKRIINIGAAKVVIFDIDGTLARMNGRSPYDYSKGAVLTDVPVDSVVELLSVFRSQGYQVVIFSGRQAICMEDTKEWLSDHGIKYEYFDMRAEGDTRKDFEVKREMYDRIKDKFDIRFVVDDRLQVCRMWHTLGLTLLKVGDPDLEF